MAKEKGTKPDVLEKPPALLENAQAAQPGPGDEEMERMSPLHFELTIAHMKLSAQMRDAARQCLVEHKMQATVATEMNINKAHLSSAVQSIREKFDEILKQNDWALVEVVLPRSLADNPQQIERYFVEPVLRARKARKDPSDKGS